MKRRNFLLSLPLIGVAGKVLAETNEPSLPKEYIRKKVNEDHLLKYPLTEKEAFEPYFFTSSKPFGPPIGTVKFVKKIGYKRYEVHVEMVMNHSMINNMVYFIHGPVGIVLDHKIIVLEDYPSFDSTLEKRIHTIEIKAFKKRNQINQGDKMVIYQNAYPEGTV